MDGNVSAAIITSSILAVIEGFKIAYAFYKDNQKKQRASADMTKSTTSDVLIKQELAKLRDMFGFNRVAVIEYHNGVTTLSGRSLKKQSMTSEVVDFDTPPIIREFQNVPTSISAEMLEELETTDKGYIMADDDSAVENTAITLRISGVRQMINFRIGNNLIDGCLSCSYSNKYREFELDEILQIKAIAKKIFIIKFKDK